MTLGFLRIEKYLIYVRLLAGRTQSVFFKIGMPKKVAASQRDAWVSLKRWRQEPIPVPILFYPPPCTFRMQSFSR